MIGSARARVYQVTPVDIHGDRYFDAVVVLGEDTSQPPTQGVRVRIPLHLCKEPPRPGEVLTLSFLMGQVSGVQREKPA